MTMEDDKPAMTRRNRTVLLIVGCFAVLIGMRIMNILSRSPEYDEIWTVHHYVNASAARILSDVATPNNHVLNSLGIRFFTSWISHTVFAMRLPALLGFAGLSVLLLRCTLILLRNKAARGAVLAAVLLDGAILHYAETARGYSLQVFFVFGLFFSLLCFAAGEPKNRLFNAVMWLICALGSCLAVSSGVVYVTVLTGLWGLLNVPFRSGFRRICHDYAWLIAAGLCWIVFVAVWYGGNYTQFAQGRSNFGETFVSVTQFLRFSWNILYSTGLIFPLPLVIAGGIRLRREPAGKCCLLAGGTVLLVLISAIFTKGGPPRVYLPLVPVVMLAAGTVLDELLSRSEKWRKARLFVLLAVLALCAWFSEPRRIQFSDPDMGTAFLDLKKSDPRVLVVYRPTDLYVVVTLFGKEAAADHVRRLESPAMLLLVHDNAIGTMRFSDSATGAVAPGCPAVRHGEVCSNLPYWLYRLRPVRPGENLSGKAVLCVTQGSAPLLRSPDLNSLLKKDFASVNGFLMNLSNELPERCCFASEGAVLNADELLQWERKHPGQLFFRVVCN